MNIHIIAEYAFAGTAIGSLSLAIGVIRSQRRFRQIATLRKNQMPSLRLAFAEALAEGRVPDAALVQTREQRQLILELLAEWSVQLSEEQCRLLRPLFSVINLDRAIRAGLRSREIPRNYDALQWFNLTGDRQHWGRVRKLARQANTQLAAIAIQGLLNSAYTDWDEVTGWLLARNSWTLSDLHCIFVMLPEEAISRLWARLTQAGDRTQMQILEALLEYDPNKVGTLIHADVVHPEALSRGLRHVNNPYYKPRVVALLGHPRDFIRVQAAKALGRIGSSFDIPQLEALLQDPDPWVRRRAAEALIRLARNTPEVLDDLTGRQSPGVQRMLDELRAIAVLPPRWG